MIRADNNYTGPTVFNGQFSGVPANGVVNQSIGLGYNLIGNPYASPISANAFISDNPSVKTLYFWTNTTAASGGSYPQNNFAAYTSGAGGVAAYASAKIPNGTIQTGQGFYLEATSSATVNFNNAQRVNASVSTQFYRNAETSDSIERNRIWLNLNDSNTSYNQILVGYIEGATNGVDQGMDGKALDNSKPMIYNLLNDEAYVIQGKMLPFDVNDTVVLGLKVLTQGNYSISLENVDGLFTSQDVFIKDNYTNIIHDIKQSEYSFSAQEGTYEDRFELVYRSGALSNEGFEFNGTLVIYSDTTGIQLNASEEIESIEVFDLLGRVLYQNSRIGQKLYTISNLQVTNHTLFVKVKLMSGQEITKKIIH